VRVKFEARNTKLETRDPKLKARNARLEMRSVGLARRRRDMPEQRERKRYDLEDRTLEFAQRVRHFVKALPRTVANIEDMRQLVRASGSVGANYIEACEALSRKDFVYRVKVCRKEAKESAYWLSLVDTGDHPETQQARQELLQESTELTKIFGAIVRKTEEQTEHDDGA